MFVLVVMFVVFVFIYCVVVRFFVWGMAVFVFVCLLFVCVVCVCVLFHVEYFWICCVLCMLLLLLFVFLFNCIHKRFGTTMAYLLGACGLFLGPHEWIGGLRLRVSCAQILEGSSDIITDAPCGHIFFGFETPGHMQVAGY